MEPNYIDLEDVYELVVPHLWCLGTALFLTLAAVYGGR
jgi:hypothetical protein